MKQKSKNDKENKSILKRIVEIFNGDIDVDELDFDYDYEVLHKNKQNKETPIKPVVKEKEIETPIKPNIENIKEENSIFEKDSFETPLDSTTTEKTKVVSEDTEKKHFISISKKPKKEKKQKIERVEKDKNDYWASGFESNFNGEEKESSEPVITFTDNTDKTKNETKTESIKDKEKKHIPVKGVFLFAASAGIVAATGYAIANREREVEVTNSAIINSIKNETQVDDVIAEFNDDAAIYNTVEGNETIDTILSGENNIVSAADKMVDLINMSNELDSYELDKALKLNGDIRSLTNEEKNEIRNMSRADLLTMMDLFKEMGDVDIQAFNKKSVDYSYLTMKLSFAKYIIDNQIMKYGTNILSTYPELIIQSIIIDESGFDTTDYVDVDIKLIDGSYYASYKALDNGSQYNVLLDSKAIRLIKDKDYFDGYTSENDSFNDFKKKALKTINDCKMMLLTDCEIKHSGPIESTRYELKTSSNYKVFKKASTIK